MKKDSKTHTNNKWAANRSIKKAEELAQKPSVKIRVKIRRNFKRFEVEEAIKRSLPLITPEFQDWYERNLEFMKNARKDYLKDREHKAWLESTTKTRNY